MTGFKRNPKGWAAANEKRRVNNAAYQKRRDTAILKEIEKHYDKPDTLRP